MRTHAGTANPLILMAILPLAVAYAFAAEPANRRPAFILPLQLDAGLQTHTDLIVEFDVDRAMFAAHSEAGCDLSSARVFEISRTNGGTTKKEVPSQFAADSDFPKQKGAVCWLVSGELDIMETRDFEVHFYPPGAELEPRAPAWKERVPTDHLRNLIANGSFELTAPDGQQVLDWDDPLKTGIMRWDRDKARTGRTSLYCETTTQTAIIRLWSKRVPVEGGRTYTASYWEHTEDPNSKLWGTVDFYDEKGQFLGDTKRLFMSRVTAEEDGWICKTGTKRAPKEAKAASLTIGHWRILGVKAWADDAVLRIARKKAAYRLIPGKARKAQ
ncbi:MAG: hypothetical protein JXR37_29800 [Kiritimatiellae bacterium]|nr:hypothetical protein [Kiritimatiellia bacterium]